MKRKWWHDRGEDKMIKMTIKEAREFYKSIVERWYKNTCKDEIDFMTMLKYEGYIKESALEKAKSLRYKMNSEITHANSPLFYNLNELCDLYEQAIKEQEKNNEMPKM